MEHYIPGTVLSALLIMWHDIFIKLPEANIFIPLFIQEHQVSVISSHWAQGHWTSQWQRQNLNSDLLDSKSQVMAFIWSSYAFPIICNHLLKFLLKMSKYTYCQWKFDP